MYRTCDCLLVANAPVQATASSEAQDRVVVVKRFRVLFPTATVIPRRFDQQRLLHVHVCPSSGPAGPWWSSPAARGLFVGDRLFLVCHATDGRVRHVRRRSRIRRVVGHEEGDVPLLCGVFTWRSRPCGGQGAVSGQLEEGRVRTDHFNFSQGRDCRRGDKEAA